MSSFLRLRLVPLLCLALLFALSGSARALQLGETHEQLVARHGPPNDEDHGRNLATYFWDGWSAQLEFRGGIVSRITYKRDWYLRDEEIASLLAANGGAGRWTEITDAGDQNRLWAREDGAAASCMAVHPLNMVFESGPAAGAAPAAPKAPATAVPVPAPSPAVDPLEQFAAALESAPSPSAPSTEPAPPQPPVTPATTGGPTPNPQRQPVVAAPAKHGFALALAAGAVLALAGAALYILKRRSSQPGARSTGAARGVAALPSPIPGREIANLTTEQLELLLTGAFRREGYRVELSPALDTDGIDLTLRRDLETVLVHCRHSNSARVDESDVRHFLGAVAVRGASRGILLTTGEFTEEAWRLGPDSGLDLLDGSALGKRLTSEAAPAQREIPAVAIR